MYVPFVCPFTRSTEQQDQLFAISFSGLYAFPVDPQGNAELAEFWPRPQEVPLAQRPVLGAGNPFLPASWAVCAPHLLANNSRLVRELACSIYTVPWLVKAVKPGLLHRLGTGRGPAVLQALWVKDKGHEGLVMVETFIIVPWLENSINHKKFKNPINHKKFKNPSSCLVSTQSRRPLDRQQLRICQEDGVARYAAKALPDSTTAKDFLCREWDKR